jgi:hypothetical protein
MMNYLGGEVRHVPKVGVSEFPVVRIGCLGLGSWRSGSFFFVLVLTAVLAPVARATVRAPPRPGSPAPAVGSGRRPRPTLPLAQGRQQHNATERAAG